MTGAENPVSENSVAAIRRAGIARNTQRTSLSSGPIGVLDLLGRGKLPRRIIGRATCICPGTNKARGTTSKGQVCWPHVVFKMRVGHRERGS